MKKILVAFTVLFFGAMLFLTCFAETLHNASLPHVTAARPAEKLFPYEYTDENGNTFAASASKIAVSEEILENGVYVIYSGVKNGTQRNFVRLAEVQTGRTADGYAEIISGIDFYDKIVVDSTGELVDGGEVILNV